MKTLGRLTWCFAGLLAGVSLANDQQPKWRTAGMDYNLTESSLPSPAMLKTAKPAAPNLGTAKQAEAPELNVDAAELKPVAADKAKPEAPLPVLPVEQMKTAKTLEPAVVKPAPPPSASVTPAGYITAVDDHMKCVECLKLLSGSAIESDRKTALAELSKRAAWKQMKTAYMILRRVVLTEYNTKMREGAVKLLGEAMMEHALVADTLKLSAQYDSEASIRAAAMTQLERLAALPPDRVVR